MSVKRELAERAHYFCSMCRAPTVGPGCEPTRSVRAGDAAHITAAAEGGPRYVRSLTREQRRSAENGIWLCGTHADLVDRDADRYSADDLRRMKTEHEAWVTRWLEGRHRHPDEVLDSTLAALAVHDIRNIGWRLHGPEWNRLDTEFNRLRVYGDPLRYGAEVTQEYLQALDNVVGRMRGAVSVWERDPATLDLLADAASNVDEAITRALPIFSLVGRTSRRPSEPEVENFAAAARIGGEMAYDGALYIWDLRVVHSGAEILWRVLRYGHLNGINAVQSDAAEEFDKAIDAARRSHWPERHHALAFMEFRRADALSDPRGEPPPMPGEAWAAIQAAYQAGRARAS